MDFKEKYNMEKGGGYNEDTLKKFSFLLFAHSGEF